MTVEVMGIRVGAITKLEALKIAQAFLVSGRQHQITTPNPEIIVKAQTDSYFLKILNSADLNLCDGFGLWLAARQKLPRAARKNFNRITGVDFMFDICRLGEAERASVYLLGSQSEAVVNRAAVELKKQFPHLHIVGTSPGPKILENRGGTIELDARENSRVLADIKNAAPTILFVAFGMGKQEKWVFENIAKMPSVKIAMGVGGAFDYISGVIPRAPRLVQNIGLEWMYRLIRQPRRIGRIFNATVKFLYYYTTKV